MNDKPANLHPASQYYLHVNGDIIYKPHGGIDVGSPFVKKCWNANPITETPQAYLAWLKECVKLGGREERIWELVERQKLNEFIPTANDELQQELRNRS